MSDISTDIIERIFIAASLLLVVVTVIFSEFLNANKFWHDKTINFEILLLDENLNGEKRAFLEDKLKESRSEHYKQGRNARIFAGSAGTLFFIAAYCLPIGIWKKSSRPLRGFISFIILNFAFLGIMCFFYAFRLWNP
jgi:hypothetical protein